MPTNMARSSYGVAAPSKSTSGDDLTSILTDLHVGLEAKVSVLAGVTADNYSYDQVNNVVLDIKLDLEVAVDAIKALPVGALGTGDILVLLSAVINLIIVPCGKIYALAGVDQVALRACFSVLGLNLAALIKVLVL